MVETSMARPEYETKCSFCGKASAKVPYLIAGIAGSICAECIDLVYSEALLHEKPAKLETDVSPQGIVEYLNQHVVGQDRAKKVLAVSVFNHIKRCFSGLSEKIDKSNVFILGPSGSGKTLLLSKIAEYVDLPFAHIDASTITEVGYVGEDPESCLVRLLQAAEGNVEAAQCGIVFIDEADKLVSSESGGQRDIKGKGVQQSLLRMIEGDIVSVNPTGKKKNGQDPLEMINTKNILFVLGGAFTGLKDMMKPKELGIGSINLFKDRAVKATDLVKYGMIPELVGRVPVIAELDPLSEDQMVAILTEPKNSLVSQYKLMLEHDGIALKFEPAFLKEVARRALAEGTGARGLRTLLEQSLLQIMYDAPKTGAESKKANESEVAKVGAEKQLVTVTVTKKHLPDG
jgi:ATP-dependent Clp protease ATP-binding subunit ClpX